MRGKSWSEVSELHIAVGKGRGKQPGPAKKKKKRKEPPQPCVYPSEWAAFEAFCSFWEFVDWKGIVLPSSLVTEAEQGNPPHSPTASGQVPR